MVLVQDSVAGLVPGSGFWFLSFSPDSSGWKRGNGARSSRAVLGKIEASSSIFFWVELESLLKGKEFFVPTDGAKVLTQNCQHGAIQN